MVSERGPGNVCGNISMAQVLGPRVRRMLFIGDDELTGIGNEARTGSRVPDAANSNCASGCAMVCADMLYAEPQLIAWSGKGLVVRGRLCGGYVCSFVGVTL